MINPPPPVKFTGNEVCPKCSAVQSVRKYVLKDDCVAANGKEHIHFECKNCGYGPGTEWIAFTADIP